MNKKTLIQVLIVIIILTISSSLYLKYFNNNSKNLNQEKDTQKIDANRSSSSSYIDNVDYASSDAKGNKYQVTAVEAEINVDNPDVMLLKDVIAYVYMKDSNNVKITSDFGNYNSINYDTIFRENVMIVYPGHKITGENLDFSLLNNLGIISTNVIYTGDKTSLFADRIEINLTTKDTKIFMINNSNKVLIERTK